MQVSDLARSVALQEEKFITFKDGLEHCLARYHKVLGALTHAEVSKLNIRGSEMNIRGYVQGSLGVWVRR